MVQLVGLVSLAVAPVLYGLNYYCVTRLIDDESLRPGRALRVWGVSGLLFMSFAVGFSLWVRFS
jgi:hypothetical protein